MFDLAARSATEVVDVVDLPLATRQRTQRIYSERLAAGATVADFVACDAFQGVLPTLDTHVKLLLSGDVALGPTTAYRDVLLHMFHHRPQRTRYLFLHEMSVGYLTWRTIGHRNHVGRRDLRLDQQDYWVLTAYFISALARLLECTPEVVSSLHFLDNASVEKRLPLSLRQFMTSACHLYWYLEVFLVYERGMSTDRALSILMCFFVLPVLEQWDRQKQGGGDSFHWRADAMLSRVLMAGPVRGDLDPNELDVARILSELSGRYWVRQPGARRKVRPAAPRRKPSVSRDDRLGTD
jgi:hypothetical protein